MHCFNLGMISVLVVSFQPESSTVLLILMHQTLSIPDSGVIFVLIPALPFWFCKMRLRVIDKCELWRSWARRWLLANSICKDKPPHALCIDSSLVLLSWSAHLLHRQNWYLPLPGYCWTALFKSLWGASWITHSYLLSKLGWGYYNIFLVSLEVIQQTAHSSVTMDSK